MQAREGQPAEQVKYRLVKAAGGVSGGTVASILNMMFNIDFYLVISVSSTTYYMVPSTERI